MAREMTAKRHEFIGVLILTVAALLFVCLISYDARDSSFNALSYKVSADNMAGKIGAYVSDILFQCFGYSAYLLLFPLAILSWKLVRGQEIHSPYFRAVGFCLILGSLSTTLHLLPPKLLPFFKPTEVNFVPGGVTGSLLSDLLLPNLNKTGTAIILVAAFVLGLLAATTLSLQSAFSKLVKEEDPAKPSLWERFRSWRESRKPVRTVLNIK
ncbi:MAG TPA: DNA translocase FtsK 4TM domain-containing protein, partial [Acidobacteriota bacterium]|nr:DNA translocase FtsK 4TM domain-containing protein [Acidobacteriota bacterium]